MLPGFAGKNNLKHVSFILGEYVMLTKFIDRLFSQPKIIVIAVGIATQTI